MILEVTKMGLVIFDLDETIVSLDTDVAWSDYLIKHNRVEDINSFKQEKETYYQAYLSGNLDIHRYLSEFVLKISRNIPSIHYLNGVSIT